jgi:exodeoxyribonuclease V alpha subunit
MKRSSEALDVVSGRLQNITKPYGRGWRKASVVGIGIVTGVMDDFSPGDLLEFQGKWKTHEKYGKQFEAKFARVLVPKDIAGLQKYLERAFRWIGPVLSRKLVEKFGENLFDMIDHDPKQLVAVHGITPERAMEIHNEYQKIKGDREQDKFFATHGITVNLRNKLMDVYGDKAKVIEQIKYDPYVLSDEVWGIGFRKADVIALSTGIKKDATVRVDAGVEWILKEASRGAGHCYLPVGKLISEASTILECSNEIVSESIRTKVAAGRLVDDHLNIAHSDLHQAETFIAGKLRGFAQAHHEVILSELTPDQIAEMDSDQQLALNLALSSKVMVVTGGPGTGKTWTVNRIIQALGDRRIDLAAPTGKAAKRMSEMTGRPARTIHRLLEFNPLMGGFQCDLQSPLDCDTLIIDETSMIDVSLMAALLDAVTNRTQLVFVGDVDQLPSVGPGRVLSDMIDSGVIPTARLQTLHRQAAESYINVNAQRVNRGEKLLLSKDAGDFWFYGEEAAENIPAIIDKAVQAIQAKFGFTGEDIQVLCPQKRSAIGTVELNKRLREVLNPGATKLSGVPFCVGDRVIQTKNNYKLMIFNGDIGRVMDADKEYLYLAFEDLKGEVQVSYPLDKLDELQLAYALTIHKSQGSEFPAVIIPVHTCNYMMLKRNLIYTGITRAKKFVLLVGTMKAVNLAIRTVDASQRFTNLKAFLREAQA